MIFGMWDAEFFHIGPLPVDHLVVTQWGLILLVAFIAFLGTRKMTLVPRGLQNVLEYWVEWTGSFFGEIIEDKIITRRVTPILATFFVFILVCNYSGLFPGAGALDGFQPPTANWNATLGLALITVGVVHYTGLRENKLHYFRRFLNPINILEEVTHPTALTLRLFGNIFAEETILVAIMFLAPFMVPTALMGMTLLLGAIQALVFTLLSASYIGSAAGKGH
jgi:F-type H+-transporting ATPase subunit a